MAADARTTELELLLERRIKEVEETARKEAERARNEAIGALGFFALVLSLLAYFGGPSLVEAGARRMAENRIDQLLSEFRTTLQAAADHASAQSASAQADATAAGAALQAVAAIKSRIGSGQFDGDISAKANQWGECVWVDFSEDQSGNALERLGRNTSPDYGCPDGTFLTHVDHDDVANGHKVIRHTRCCKP